MATEIENLDEFNSVLEQCKSMPVVIDFYGTRCPPCRAIAPEFEGLARSFPAMAFYKINVDNSETEEIVQACKISCMPTFCFFFNGEYQEKISGANVEALQNKVLWYLNKCKQTDANVQN